MLLHVASSCPTGSFAQSLLLDSPAAFRRDRLWAYKVALPKNLLATEATETGSREQLAMISQTL